MTSERPVEIAPTSYLPVTAVASITHRITGVALFVGTAYLIYLLDLALDSDAGFARAGALIGTGLGKFALWITLAALAYHFIAGIRHLLLDFHVGDSLVGARRSAWATLGLSFLAAAAAGAWLW